MRTHARKNMVTRIRVDQAFGRFGLLMVGAFFMIMSQLAEAQVIPGEYIVVLKDGVGKPAEVAKQLAGAHGVQLGFVYEHALKGFSFSGPAWAAQALARNPQVDYVEADQVVRAHCHQGDPQVVPTGIQRIFADENPNLTIDGVDDLRIDVDVAVIDTGIDFDHFDLNVVARTNCSGGSPFQGKCKDNQGDDGNGHGTHVSGSIAAIDNGNGVVGVAPGARLHAVKVLGDNGSGQIAWVIAGIDWVTARSDEIEVANMSLGCQCSSSALDTAISNSVASGVIYSVSAGNSDANTANFSPASHPDVITVSALADSDGDEGGIGGLTCNLDQDDTLANFSNWGSAVEITAPGDCILSLWTGGLCATISGTSMSSPHVAGAAALLASGGNDPTNKADVDAIISTLIAEGNFNWTDDSGDGAVNKEPLLDVSNMAVFAPATVPGDDQPCVVSEAPEFSCGDGLDNDCDGLVDCDDADCSGDAACADPCGDGVCDGAGGEDQCSCSLDCGTPPASETSCNDGVDEDCDGATDCSDSDCDGDAACDCGLGLVGDLCTDDGDCCSNKCKGKPGSKSCK